jgi:hypothetical protein
VEHVGNALAVLVVSLVVIDLDQFDRLPLAVGVRFRRRFVSPDLLHHDAPPVGRAAEHGDLDELSAIDAPHEIDFFRPLELAHDVRRAEGRRIRVFGDPGAKTLDGKNGDATYSADRGSRAMWSDLPAATISKLTA